MDIFSLNVEIKEPCTIALGYFDGVHLGHREVIKSAVKMARKMGIKCGVFTFTDKQKKCYKKAKRGEIYSRESCLELMKELGVDFVIMPDFLDFCNLSAEEFVKLLTERYCAKALFCGENYRFGKKAAGDIQLLKALSLQNGAEVFIIQKVLVDGILVSSTEICTALKEGKIQLANKLLGRNFFLRSEVVYGKHIGSKRLYPTINQNLSQDSTEIKNGVYASQVFVADKCYKAVTNIGVCPTVKDDKTQITCESYIIDEQLELYGKIVSVELVGFLRDEKKFESIDALKTQITADIKAAKEIL